MHVVNIVISGTMGQKINLDSINHSLDCFTYNPEFYHGGYLQLHNYTATIYQSGKYIIPGVKLFEEIPKLFQEMKCVLQDILDTSLLQYPQIRNIVASAELGYPVDLTSVCSTLFSNGYQPDYEPETFPGLIIHLDQGTINLFSSGKYILLGTTQEKDLIQLNDYFLSLVSN